MDFDHKEARHHKTRAVGQLYMGPMKAKGYDNRVMEITVQEMEFKNSHEAEKFIDYQKRRLANKNLQMRQRRMKLASISSD